MSRVFISYRSDDDRFLPGQIAETLRRRLGAGVVFLDVSNLRAGDRYPDALRDHLESADVLVACIGRRWQLGGAPGRVDWMRYEVGWALEHGRPVIPALLDRSTMPDLPLADLAELGLRQACQVRPGSLAADLETLADVVVALLRNGRVEGVSRDRPAIDAFLVEHLPRMQRWGSTDRGDLAEIVMSVLPAGERLLDLTPCRVGRTPRGSWVLVTSDRYVRLVGRDTPNTTRQVLAFPLHKITGVSLRRGWPSIGGSDEVAIRTVRETVVVSNVFRSQAERLCALLERLIDGPAA